MKRRFKFGLAEGLIVSSLIHVFAAFGMPNSCSFGEPQSKPYTVQLVDRETDAEKECGGGDGSVDGDSDERMSNDLEGYIEHIPKPDEIDSERSIPDSFLTREHHYERILSGEMFPGLRYLDVPLPTKRKMKTTLLLDFGDGGNNAAAPLPRNRKQLQSTLDELMPLPKEDQLDTISKHISANPGSKRDVANLVREFYKQNMVRVVYKYSDEQLVVDLFEEQLNKEQLFEYVYEYLEHDPDSEVAVEMLFMLERTYNNSQNNIGTALTNGQTINYDKDIMTEVSNRIQYRLEKRVDALLDEDRDKEDSLGIYLKLGHVESKIIQKRIDILERIVEIDGYRKNDALFLLGRVLYDKDSSDKAWAEPLRQIDPDDETFFFKEYYMKSRQGISTANKYLVERGFWSMDFDNGRLIEERGRKFIWEKKEKRKNKKR